MDDLFERLLQETPDDTKRFVARSMDVSDQITSLLKKKNISQRQLADKLGKKESEISKWLSGNHNFTLRTLAKIESILMEDILIAPMFWNEYKGAFSKEATGEQAHVVKKVNLVFSTGVSMKAHVNTKAFRSQEEEVAGEYSINSLNVA